MHHALRRGMGRCCAGLSFVALLTACDPGQLASNRAGTEVVTTPAANVVAVPAVIVPAASAVAMPTDTGPAGPVPIAPGTQQPASAAAPTATAMALPTDAVAARSAPVAPTAGVVVQGASARTLPVVIDAPQNNLRIVGPIELQGRVQSVAEGQQLVYRLLNGAKELASGPIMIAGEPGQPGTFAATIDVAAAPDTPVRLEIVDAKNTGQPLTAVNLVLAAAPDVATLSIDTPLDDTTVPNVVEVRGTVTQLPAGANLNYQVYDGDQLLAEGPVEIDPAAPETFAVTVDLSGNSGDSRRIMIVALDPETETPSAAASVDVMLQ